MEIKCNAWDCKLGWPRNWEFPVLYGTGNDLFWVRWDSHPTLVTYVIHALLSDSAAVDAPGDRSVTITSYFLDHIDTVLWC